MAIAMTSNSAIHFAAPFVIVDAATSFFPDKTKHLLKCYSLLEAAPSMQLSEKVNQHAVLSTKKVHLAAEMQVAVLLRFFLNNFPCCAKYRTPSRHVRGINNLAGTGI